MLCQKQGPQDTCVLFVALALGFCAGFGGSLEVLLTSRFWNINGLWFYISDLCTIQMYSVTVMLSRLDLYCLLEYTFAVPLVSWKPSAPGFGGCPQPWKVQSRCPWAAVVKLALAPGQQVQLCGSSSSLTVFLLSCKPVPCLCWLP